MANSFFFLQFNLCGFLLSNVEDNTGEENRLAIGIISRDLATFRIDYTNPGAILFALGNYRYDIIRMPVVGPTGADARPARITGRKENDHGDKSRSFIWEK